jgi:beta-galactosidase
MYVGVAYYPEHWRRERWPVDAELMKKAGINVVRLAEFAWVKMEPREGVYQFDWLDEAIGILERQGIKVILGTPTESMPAWVAKRYPEALATRKDGRREAYGARRDNCPTSVTYRRLGQGITAAMARHYAGHPAVIGWQIDNEFSGPYCYCDECAAAFRGYLAERHGTIDEFNRRLGTIFWGHTYGSFDELPLPRRTDGNPSLELEFKRFHSRQVVSFQREQVQELRRLASGQFITHNMCGVFVDQIDYFELAKDLDVAGLDYYYNNSPWPNRLNVYPYEAVQMDFTRSMKKRNFWVTETPSGPIGSAYFLRNLRPLEMRRLNYQALGHGAEGLLWFRWRTCLYGMEQYTHGILGHDGVPGRRYRDVSRVAHEFHALAPALVGSTVRAEVAILYTYDNRWAMQIQPNARNFDWFNHLFQYHRALKRQGVNVDFVNTGEALDAYRAVVVPAGYLMMPDQAARLEAFVRRGGRLLVTTRTAVKDQDNIPHELTLPGLLRGIAGVRIEEYEALLEDSPVRFEADLGGATFAANHLADWIVPETARVLARYAEPYLQEFAAVTVNDVGPGRVYYVGTCFTADEAIEVLARRLLDDAGIARPVAIPRHVCAVTREKGSERFLFLMNHDDEAVELDLSALPPRRELISKTEAADKLVIPGGDVAIIHWMEPKGRRVPLREAGQFHREASAAAADSDE